MPMLHLSATELLLQIDQMIDQCEDSDFALPLDELSGSTFGQHIRHTLEFFICLFDAKKTKVVNYDSRKHDQLIETDKKLARSIIGSIIDFVNGFLIDFQFI